MRNLDVSFEGRAAGILVVGDSNSLIFHGMRFRSMRRPTLSFVAHTQYLVELRLAGLVSETGDLDARVRDALMRGGAIKNTVERVPVNTQADSEAQFGEFDAQFMMPAGMTSRDRAIVAFSVGHRDFARILVQLGPTVDFSLPAVRHGEHAMKAIGSTESLPASVVEELLAPALIAFESAMSLLVDGGLHNVYFIGLRPPTLDDDEFEARWQIRSRAHLRTKVTLLMNARLEEACDRVGVRFVDTWPFLTVDGDYFDERFELDHVHINANGAQADRGNDRRRLRHAMARRRARDRVTLL